ncbi:MAG: phage tail protein [Elusimicrobiales bacterium]|nr:phage tail protein [Elusimicrobiales bacterium]
MKKYLLLKTVFCAAALFLSSAAGLFAQGYPGGMKAHSHLTAKDGGVLSRLRINSADFDGNEPTDNGSMIIAKNRRATGPYILLENLYVDPSSFTMSAIWFMSAHHFQSIEADDYSGGLTMMATEVRSSTFTAARKINSLEASFSFATIAYLDSRNEVGELKTFAMSSCPTGYLAADGSDISTTTYSDLFAKVGHTYDTYISSAVFKTPDMRGMFVRGYDNGAGVDPARVFGSTQADTMQGHVHSWPVIAYVQFDGGNGTHMSGNATGVNNTSDPLADPHGNGTPRTSAETRPKNIALLYCIKI